MAVPKYREVFPNKGDGNMVANLRALKEAGYQGYLVPDHILSFGGGVSPGTPAENIDALLRTARDRRHESE